MSTLELDFAAFEQAIIAFAEELLSWIPIPGSDTTPTTVPGVTPPAIPPPSSGSVAAVDKVAAAIYAYNRSRAYFRVAQSFTIPAKGVIIHAITMAQANAQSPIFQAECKRWELDLSFALACSAEESVFDPNCQNGNEGPGESNTANDPLGYDMGVEQLKLRYLIGYDGIKTAADADSFALDVTKAIPYFCSIMSVKLAAAKSLIATPTSATIDPRLKASPELCATGMYNFGDTGFASDYFEKGLFPSHCQQVEDLTNYFAKALGVASIFANLPQ